jgi:diaminohydroxyphosphoribosylaminopyrimidine deaminase/5-amino-6-(5-phosphoribosylamino)uracil reductase
VRIVFDRFLRLDDGLNVFDRSQTTICYNLLRHEEHVNLLLVRLGEENFWEEMIHDLYNRKIQSVMVEGGAQTLETFIQGGWWDEARVFRSMRTFGKGIAAPGIQGHFVSEEKIMDDTLSIYWNESPTKHH